MDILVTYDIADPEGVGATRLRRIADVCGKYGHRAHASPHFAVHQITPKTSRYTRCSSSMLPNVSINGRIRSSGQFGRW